MLVEVKAEARYVREGDGIEIIPGKPWAIHEVKPNRNGYVTIFFGSETALTVREDELLTVMREEPEIATLANLIVLVKDTIQLSHSDQINITKGELLDLLETVVKSISPFQTLIAKHTTIQKESINEL